jgi:hypothetical protein
MSATGDRSYAYDRPIVVRGDTPAPAIEVSPAGPWVDGQHVTVTLRNLEPRRFGVLAYCLDTARMQQVEDHGSGDGLNPACMPLAELTPTATGTWPPPIETFELPLPRTLVDNNGASYDCGDPQGCRLVAFWSTDTYLASGVGTIAWFGP